MEMTMNDSEQGLLADYRRLHDRLSDMIEGGRLRRSMIPNDYDWLIDKLIECNSYQTRHS
jgi:hypothetical protein